MIRAARAMHCSTVSPWIEPAAESGSADPAPEAAAYAAPWPCQRPFLAGALRPPIVTEAVFLPPSSAVITTRPRMQFCRVRGWSVISLSMKCLYPLCEAGTGCVCVCGASVPSPAHAAGSTQHAPLLDLGEGNLEAVDVALDIARGEALEGQPVALHHLAQAVQPGRGVH